MRSLQVFDPPQCCSTGVCGPSVDPALARFAADLDWLQSRGVRVERLNPAQQPVLFAANPHVLKAVTERGEGALPLLLAGEQVLSSGTYPSREQLAAWAGVPFEAPAPDVQPVRFGRPPST